MPSAEHEQIVDMMRQGLGLEALSVEEQRAVMEASAEMFPPEPDVLVESIDAGGVPADWVWVEDSDPERVILYLHGGAYVMGSRNTHRGLAGRIARAARARVLLAEYRLAPEQPFPAAVDDATACWRWLLGEGLDPSRMAVAGDSAGGGLALATLLALADAGDPLPACAVGLSPWTDLEGTGPTAAPGAVDDPMIAPENLRESGRHYAGDDLRNPFAAPLHGELSGLPPLLIQVGTREVLLSDSTRFAEKAKAAGVEVDLQVEDGLIHVWQMFPNLPESASAVEQIGSFIEGRTGSRRRPVEESSPG